MPIILSLVLIAIAWLLVGIYNRLVTARNAARGAFAQIDVQLTQRHGLAQNLVEAAGGYLQQERGMLEAVLQARELAVSSLKVAAADPANSAAIGALSMAENQLAGALARLLAVVAAHPELKAGLAMGQLSAELGATDNRIAIARQAYNDAVMAYNNSREVFPNNFIASNFDFAPMQILEMSPVAAREVPRLGVS